MARGMENKKGFYNYEPGETEAWEAAFRKFSYQVHEIISKYSHLHRKENSPVKL